MKESKVSKQLTLRWVPVVDAKGRTRLEAVWLTDVQLHAHSPHAA